MRFISWAISLALSIATIAAIGARAPFSTIVLLSVLLLAAWSLTAALEAEADLHSQILKDLDPLGVDNCFFCGDKLTDEPHFCDLNTYFREGMRRN